MTPTEETLVVRYPVTIDAHDLGLALGLLANAWLPDGWGDQRAPTLHDLGALGRLAQTCDRALGPLPPSRAGAIASRADLIGFAADLREAGRRSATS